MDCYKGESSAGCAEIACACKEKHRLVSEYALRGVAKPMGVAEYQLLRQVPESLESKLPSIDQIEAELRPDLPDHA
jgi:hypothetical protein